VHDWIRALTHPYPGAFSHLDGRRLFLWRSTVPGPSDGEAAAAPGTILGRAGQALQVATCDGSVKVLRVQEEGGPEESGASWYLRRASDLRRRFRPVDATTSRWALGLGAGGS
jgi:methionyl-tRNA formyltransferase